MIKNVEMKKFIDTEFPNWGFSSSGRAPALQAGGERFDPVNLHQMFGGLVVNVATTKEVSRQDLARS